MNVKLEFRFLPKVCHLELLKTAIESVLLIAGIDFIWTFQKDVKE